ncbi:hypothetical protein FB567DRAFT_589793 [Paraphoma chrysanthemicola]|uniref:Uncharacterized protein n=1 Tax=Paraphoma chrysanthemicola TaxID=798071 RepID=A0A8K0RAE0_9PLEO|nr:hypothetical protein FB567DRAFT_589793 [Paraphoma chrysanthemicola]
MEPQHPPAPYSATYAHQSQQPNQPPTHPANSEYECTYNEKDSYPQLQSSRTERGSKASSGRAHDSVISHPFSPKQSYPPSPTSSISSAGGQQQKSNLEIQYSSPNESQNLRYPPQAHLDPEKQGYESSQGHRAHRHSGSGRGANDAVYDQGEYHESAPEEKAWQLLFFLSGPCALLSVLITLWSLAALLVSLALAPLKFCTTRPPLSSQLTTFLAPALNLQLHLVYSHNASQDYSAPMLVIIHLFSPVIAFGVAIAAWTAAGFWFFSSILGDPGGHDGGRHNDGKESILGVRKWWERWLSRALR